MKKKDRIKGRQPSQTFMLEEDDFLGEFYPGFRRKGRSVLYVGGADVLMQAGRHMVKEYPNLPMLGLMIPVSVSGLLMSEEAKERMKEIDPRDPILHWNMFDTMVYQSGDLLDIKMKEA